MLNINKNSIDSVIFSIIDVETTGLNPAKDEIIEIGLVKVKAGKVIDEFESLIHPKKKIPLKTIKIHGITMDDVFMAPYLSALKPKILDFISDTILVDHSKNRFDITFLEVNLAQKFDNLYISTYNLSVALFPNLVSYSLENMCQYLGIIKARAHKAIEDARATAKLLSILLCNLQKRGVRSISDLIKFIINSP